MYAISLEFSEAGVGLKNLNIKDDYKLVGEWIEEVEFQSLNNIPKDLMCFSLERWLTLIKPKFKEGAKYYRDSH